jgi:hypothetical protein
LLTGGNLPDESRLTQARTLLREALREKPLPYAEGYALCKDKGIGTRTTETAKRLESKKSIKLPDGWYWTREVLP